ncbi:MAG: TlpA family protein disulfide reductase [Gammaproteobacteria bacterium]|nr:TlpA family protein disulfide reductase [Gammaproteobacteria bacterium]
MKRQYFVYLAIFIGGIWGGNEIVKLVSNQDEIQQAAEITFNTQAANFELPDLEGTTHQFNEWAGKVRVLNFWATWCPPCRKETPMFIEMQEQYGAQGLQFVGVAIDEPEKVQDFVDTYGVNYPTLVGAESAIEVAKQYGNRFGALPYTVIINRQGTIVHAQSGEMTRQNTESLIRPLL